ncbi:SAM-dependent methyltransferase [Streptomyces sp. SBT349]|uniref:SAM-dependent methyltransferase n=1 Tax=Streptomyces sp. SBT349 TaxID=1580539 RepID=UPI00069D18F9
MLRHLAVRTRFFDDYLLHAAADGGCHQVVVPAAGLDTRAFRLNWPPNVACYEIDAPEMMAFRERVLAGQAAEPAVARRVPLAADLRGEWTKALLGAGFDPAERSAWLVEGPLIHLEAAESTRLLGEIGDLAAPGSRLALAHGLDPGEAAGPDSEPGSGPGSEPDGDPAGAPRPPGSAPEEDPAAWLTHHGWRATRHDRAAAATSYGRPPGYLTPRLSYLTAERRPPAVAPAVQGRS